MEAVRVMIVEDSPSVREQLVQLIGSDPRMRVVAACKSAEEALEQLEEAAPDVISMDIHLPKMNGLDATRRIMDKRPTPIVIVSRSSDPEELDLTMEALRAGAVSVVDRPNGGSKQDFEEQARRICRDLVVMSQVKVVRQRFNRRKRRPIAPPPVPLPARAPVPAEADVTTQQHAYQIVGLAASTGGPRAVEIVLTALGHDFPLPILLVHHMTPSFHSGFIAWLDRVVPQKVVEAHTGDNPHPGHVYVAPADWHLLVRAGRIVLDKGAPVSGQRPSATLLFQSLADDFGPRAVGVVLTGMGDDGAEGLLAMKQAGAYTIAEDPSTAVVDGMPGTARHLGAVCDSLALDAIGPTIRRHIPAISGNH